jgi:3-oxoacyl-[acyl-carrier protein] reductase
MTETKTICRRLEGRVAIVTGGGHGIGKAYAKRLADEGAHLVVVDIDGKAAEQVAAQLIEMGSPKAYGFAADVTKESDLAAMVEKTVGTFGRIDILVNNAAMFATVPMSRLPFDQLSPEEWDKLMSVNLKGIWLAARAVAPVMREAKYGKIINISSGSAFKGTGGRIHYVTSKAGVLGFTKTLAHDLGADNITVNAIAPGSTLSEEKPTEEVLKYRAAAGSKRPLARQQSPEDIVGAVAFFASPDSDFITGQTLVVDGGAYMH